MANFIPNNLPDPDEDGLLDLPLFDDDDAPPMMPAAAIAPPPAKPVRSATVKEKVVLPPRPAPDLPSRKPPPRKPPTEPAAPTSDYPKPVEPTAPAYRPRERPPMALLVILDDGREDGEVVRLRGDVTVIGRTQGEVRIPHDSLVSSKHVEIRRVRDEEAKTWRWVLSDCDSSNGTFVKVTTVSLRSGVGKELQVGHTRLRFEAPANEGENPALVEMTEKGPGRRFALAPGHDNWIGTDPAGAVVLGDDPLIAKKHAHLYRDAKGDWHLGEGSGRDGVWLRRDRVTIDKSCSFQLGEQRFLLRVP